MYENDNYSYARNQERVELARGNDARQAIFGNYADCNRIQAYQYMHGQED